VSRPLPNADVNLTPLVDVMLVVLALFMITAPAVLLGPAVSLPDVPVAATSLSDAEAVVTIAGDGRVFYGERRVDGDLVGALRSDPALRDHGLLYVRGDREVRFESVARVLDAARAADVVGVHLVVDPALLIDVAPGGGRP